MDKTETGKIIKGYPLVADRNNSLDYAVHSSIDEAFIHLFREYQNRDIQTGIAFLEMMGVIVDVNINIFDYQIDTKKRLDKVAYTTS